MVSNTLLTKCKEDYDLHKITYETMQRYYDGNSDALINYQEITSRANNKVKCNFIKKFINEEATYVCGNKITYTSFNNDPNVINDLRLNFKHWSEKHNKELCKQSLIFNEAYELYYVDDHGFNSLICTPLDSYILQDDYGNIQLFIRYFHKKFDDTKTLYADVYSDDGDIVHYTCTGTSFIQIPNSKIDKNIFSKVPVSVVTIGTVHESLFSILKGLQDGYETILSDTVNEISDFRNAYLAFTGCELDETQIADMKKLGILNLPTKDAKVEWLIKTINDTFIQNTLTTLEDKMYQLASHINNNEKMVSNTSSLALRNRLISLEQKCANNIQSLQDSIKIRLEFLFEYLYKIKGSAYDWRDIDIKIVPCIPTDDLMISQIINSLKGVISTKTALSQLSFIDNPEAEMKELQDENSANSIGQDIFNKLNNSNNSEGIK